MPRNKSRSRSRERRRSRSRERVSRREPHKRANRSRSPRHRSRSPTGPATTSRRRSRSHSPRRRSESPRKRSRSGDSEDGHSSKNSKPEIDESQLEGMSQEEAEMMRTMGFSGFETTKGKKVHNNNIYVAKLTQKRRYRQYMNRRGGFNRPLDFIA